MPRFTPLLGLGGVLALGACAVQGPLGPTVAVMPPPGKSYPEFQREDLNCRQQAQASIGYANPNEAANRSAIGSALIGTGLGAAIGALIGAGTGHGHAGQGAAVGAGAGLLTGSAVGANNAGASRYAIQRAYNITYLQCMAASGNQLPGWGPSNGYPYAYAPSYSRGSAEYPPSGAPYPPPGGPYPPPYAAGPPPGSY